MEHHADRDVFGGLELDTNWGSYNVYSTPDGMKSIVVKWRTDKVVKRFSGETAHIDADRFASDLHWAHDLR